MNSNDYSRAASLAADLQTIQEILRKWANENRQLAGEIDRLRSANATRTLPPEPRAGSPVFLTPKQLANRWGMHHGSILRKLRQRELPSMIINSRSIRVAMMDVLAYEAQNRISHK